MASADNPLIRYVGKEFKKTFLFDWNKVPGSDEGKLKAYLSQDFGIDWVQKASIYKTDDSTIEVDTEENSLSLELNNEKSGVKIETDDERTVKLFVKEENGNINIYKNASNWEAEFISLEELWKPTIQSLVSTYKQTDSLRPKNLCVFGEAFSGKSTFFKYFVNAVRTVENLDKFGIVKIGCPTNATLKGIYRRILRRFNWTITKSDSIQELEDLIGKAVKKHNCKMIIIDEFNQLYERADKNRIKEVLKALRNIPNITERPIVVVGTLSTEHILNMDSETNSRFFKEEFPNFKLVKNKKKENKEKLRLYASVMLSLDENLKETTGIVSSLAEDKSSLKKLLGFCEGKMGALVGIYECAVEIVFRENYLFSWGDIPGSDNESLIEYLNKNYGFHWLKTAQIEKTDDNMTIKAFSGKKSLSLKLNDEKSQINVITNSGRTHKLFVARLEDDIRIYKEKKELDKSYLNKAVDLFKRNNLVSQGVDIEPEDMYD